jgi:hypothetical protein
MGLSNCGSKMCAKGFRDDSDSVLKRVSSKDGNVRGIGGGGAKGGSQNAKSFCKKEGW